MPVPPAHPFARSGARSRHDLDVAATDRCQIGRNLAGPAFVSDLDVNKGPAAFLIPIDVRVLRRNGPPIDFTFAQALRPELGIF